jgi:CHAT domain-containing protein
MVQRNLVPGHLVLEYVLHSTKSYCLVIGDSGISFFDLPGKKEIEELADAYANQLRRKERASDLSRRLYSLLLGKVSGIKGARRLTIVTDGKLGLIPFDSLIDSTGSYVLMNHVVTISPSVAAFYFLQAPQAADISSRSFLGVGGVPYSPDLFALAKSRGFVAESLGNLPGSESEVLAAAASIGNSSDASLLLGASATETAFKSARLSEQTVIHLAVHGVPDVAHPDSAALILLADTAHDEDGYLHASEVIQLKLNAKLVVLSACETGVGRLQGQDGVANLSRAFLIAGAKAVVSTLWEVDDTMSAFLMKRFYQHIAAGRDSGVALTEAKRAVVLTFGNRALPYHWAAFVFEGAAKRI